MKNPTHSNLSVKQYALSVNYRALVNQKRAIGYAIRALCNDRKELRSKYYGVHDTGDGSKLVDKLNNVSLAITLLDERYKAIKDQISVVTKDLVEVKHRTAEAQKYYSYCASFKEGDVVCEKGTNTELGDILRINIEVDDNMEYRYVATIRLGSHTTRSNNSGYFIKYVNITDLEHFNVNK